MSNSYEIDPYKISVWKFLILSFFTFGIFEIYWMYKHWKYLQQKQDLKVHSFWRSLFGLFFITSLFKRLSEVAEKENGIILKYPPETYAGAYISVYFLNYASFDNLYINLFILVASIILNLGAFVPIINMMNNYWESPHLSTEGVNISDTESF
ncbi:DUF4234 domain-containing protein [Methanococcoides sp. SA1]|nr:DUF4234 domain-containing protein [Methanococcoides sp. SA1]